MKKQDDNGVFHDLQASPKLASEPPMFLKKGDRVVVQVGGIYRPMIVVEEVVESCYTYRYGQAAPETVETVSVPLQDKILSPEAVLPADKKRLLSPGRTGDNMPLDNHWGVMKSGPDLCEDGKNALQKRKYDERVKET